MEVKQQDSSWFIWWLKIFGGALIGAVMFLLAIILNHLYGNIDASRIESKQSIEVLSSEVIKLKERLSAFEAQRFTLNEKMNGINEVLKEIASLKERLSVVEELRAATQEKSQAIDSLKEKMAALEANKESNKDKYTLLETILKELKMELQALRDKIVVLESKK